MYTMQGDDQLPTGKVIFELDFDHDGGRLNKGTTGPLYVNGNKVAQTR
jgi:hypothetical protein